MPELALGRTAGGNEDPKQKGRFMDLTRLAGPGLPPAVRAPRSLPPAHPRVKRRRQLPGPATAAAAGVPGLLTTAPTSLLRL